MKLLSGRTKDETAHASLDATGPELAGALRAPSSEGTDTPEGSTASAMQWTRGPELASKLASGVLVVALISGPVALGWVWLRPEVVSTSPGGTSEIQWSASAAVGERAVLLVKTWLQAGEGDRESVEALVDAKVPRLPATGRGVRDVEVADLTDLGGGAWSVMVGVDVEEPVEDGTVWMRRYFTVPVHAVVAEGRALVVAQALPAPAVAPSSVEAPQVAYREEVSVDGPAGATVAAFLEAMLAGSGDVRPYTHPSAAIPAITPAPYSSVEVRAITGTAVAEDDPIDGSTTHVLVDVLLVAAVESEVPSQILLELTARAGRWEVSGLDRQVQAVSEKSADA
jgi:hypothetical protein